MPVELVERESQTPAEYERNALIALGAVYGVEIQDDNAQECRERLLKQWLDAYNERMGENGADDARNQAREIVELNIVRGDFLTARTVDRRGRDTGEPIFMYSWSYGKGKMSKKRERLQEEPSQTPSLFDKQVGAIATDSESHEMTSEPSAPIEQTAPTPPPEPKPAKKSRRSTSTATKKRARTITQEEPTPYEPAVNIEPEEVEASNSVELSPPAVATASALPVASGLFPLQTSNHRPDAPNPMETFFSIFERASRIIDERAKEHLNRSDVKYVQKMLRATNEKLGIFYAAHQAKSIVSSKELRLKESKVAEACAICSGAIKGLVALTTEEQDEIVGALYSISESVHAIIEKEYDNDANE